MPENLELVISTVLNNYNEHWFRNAFIKLGSVNLVSGWRIQTITKTKYRDTSKLTQNRLSKEEKKFETAIKRIYNYWKRYYKDSFELKIDDNTTDYSSVLILPNGEIAITNSTIETREKTSIEEYKKKLNPKNHQNRYVVN